jgi:hypothetical protein
VIGERPAASTVTALVTPITCAIADLRHHGRMHALFDAGVSAHRNAEKLHAVAELGRRIDIGECDRRDAFHITALRSFGAEGKACQIDSFCAARRGPRRRRTDRLRIAELLRPRRQS